MTDQQPTNPGDIVVTGQRARGPSPFNELQFPTKGPDNPEVPEEVVDQSGGSGDTGVGISDEEVQCAMPEGRRQWNADAKAKDAKNAFLAKAATFNEVDLQNREFGALICEFGPGLVEFGPIEAGPPILDGNGNAISYPGGRASVPIPQDGCGAGTPIGYVHSHPGLGTGIPSDPDFGYAQQLKDNHGAPATVGIYIVAEYQDSQTGAYKTGVGRASLSDRTAASQGTFEPAWVNPEATPCPGDT